MPLKIRLIKPSVSSLSKLTLIVVLSVMSVKSLIKNAAELDFINSFSYLI